MVKVRGGAGGGVALWPEHLGSAPIGQEVSLAALSQAGWRRLREGNKTCRYQQERPWGRNRPPYMGRAPTGLY